MKITINTVKEIKQMSLITILESEVKSTLKNLQNDKGSGPYEL